MKLRKATILLLLAIPFIGCASKKYVTEELEKSEVRTQTQVDELKTKIEETQTEIRDLAKDFNVKLDPLEEATENNAAKLVTLEESMGQVRFQTTLSDEKALFEPDSFELADEAKVTLDQFANMILAQDKFVFIEIQGHTDSLGTEKYNDYLSEHRASAVREFLYKTHDIPLHAMNIISFGSSKPVADNSTREGRRANRRVVLVVRIKI